MQRVRLLFACVVGYCTLTIPPRTQAFAAACRLTIPPTFYVAVLYVVVVLYVTAMFVVAACTLTIPHR